MERKNLYFEHIVRVFKWYRLPMNLIYVPVIGISWWALDMPFLKRYTQKQLSKNPKLKGKDFNEMKRALKHYSLYPVTVFSFAEGTRFSHKKHLNQKSPFENLLKPKEGGLATAISLVTVSYTHLTLPTSDLV